MWEGVETKAAVQWWSLAGIDNERILRKPGAQNVAYAIQAREKEKPADKKGIGHHASV